jgi:predicted nucleic acid-binding protein
MQARMTVVNVTCSKVVETNATLTSVIASAAKQSRVVPQKDSWIASCARNHDAVAVSHFMSG